MLDRAASKMDVKKRAKGKGEDRVETWTIKEDKG
jgi:hypothetical protein